MISFKMLFKLTNAVASKHLNGITYLWGVRVGWSYALSCSI